MIRIAAARKLAEQLLHGSIVRIPVTDAILDMATRMIMTAVSLDEQRQEREKASKNIGTKG
jgi:hypothetical protein